MAVDREQYTIIDVYDGIYSESRCKFHKLSMGVICTRGLYNGWQQVLDNDNEQWQLHKIIYMIQGINQFNYIISINQFNYIIL